MINRYTKLVIIAAGYIAGIQLCAMDPSSARSSAAPASHSAVAQKPDTAIDVCETDVDTPGMGIDIEKFLAKYLVIDHVANCVQTKPSHAFPEPKKLDIGQAIPGLGDRVVQAGEEVYVMKPCGVLIDGEYFSTRAV